MIDPVVIVKRGGFRFGRWRWAAEKHRRNGDWNTVAHGTALTLAAAAREAFGRVGHVFSFVERVEADVAVRYEPVEIAPAKPSPLPVELLDDPTQPAVREAP
jgi:hypothetical protein